LNISEELIDDWRLIKSFIPSLRCICFSGSLCFFFLLGMIFTPFRLSFRLGLCAALVYPYLASAKTVSFPPHTYTLPDGYELELAAVPPLVQRPMHMYYDVDGSLYVTDSSGNTDKGPVQLETPSHRILRLVDSDGDGVFDQSTVYAENVPFPEGILAYKGSVYVGAPPHIWKFTDTDGDYVSDERVPWFDGASIGPCANDLHGPYLAPDGYFYWTKGGFQEQSFSLGNGDRHQSRAAHIFRAKPDGSNLEVVITGGMNNPVGLAFSESGERFLSGTFFDLSQPGRRDGILHAVYGGMYGRRHEVVLSEHPHTGDLLPILSQLGPSASSGILMPRNNTLRLKDDLLCADFNLRRISWHKLSRSGSSYALETSTFLESDQIDFHPTDLIEDADGSLLVADTGSWYLICCPTSQVAKPHVLGAIYRIRKTGAKAPEDPRGFDLNWESPCVSYLADERPFVVNRAIDALAKEEYIDELRKAEARVPAIWALNRIDLAEARGAVRAFIKDEDSDVRTAAIHSAALWSDDNAVSELIDTLTDEDDLLRRLAAMAVGRIGDSQAVKPLLNMGEKEQDPFLKHAITYALFELGESKNVPDDHPLRRQLRVMEATAQRDSTPNSRPEIQLAEAADRDPETVARQFARLNELMPFLKKGDAKRGEKLFADASKSLCITCHVKGDQGEDFGPDLTKIGAIRTDRDLLEAILFPSVSISRYYELVHVRTNQGEASGLLRREEVDALILGPVPGVKNVIPLEDVVEAKYSNVSLMPEVFDGLLNPQEIADLIAYLKTDTSLEKSASFGSQAREKRDRIPANQLENRTVP